MNTHGDMTRTELIELAAQGEGYHLEFKFRTPNNERLAREITALANAGGGRLLIGVGDDGSMVGLKDAAEEEYKLNQTLRDYIDPRIKKIDLLRVPISRKRQVIAAVIPRSPMRPHYVVDPNGGDRTAYIRILDKSVAASREACELMEYAGESQNIMFEMRKNERLLLRHLEDNGRITVRQFARLAGIKKVKASATLVTLTRADLLQHHPDLSDDYFTAGPALSGAATHAL